MVIFRTRNLFQMLKLLKKPTFIILFILCYFVLIRPARALVIGYQEPKVTELVQQDLVLSLDESSSSVAIVFLGENEHKKYQYKTSFGSYFLFATLLLIGIGARRNEFFFLLITHLSLGIISTVMMWVGVSSFFGALIISDLISRYLLPLSSFLIVALVYSQKLNSNVDFDE